MTEHDRHDLAEAATVERNGQGSASLMARMRAQRDQAASRKTTTFPIPDYKDPQLVPEFRILGSVELKEIGARVRDQYEDEQDRLYFGLLDQTLKACTRIYVREAGSRELKLLDPDGAGPMQFDSRLADFLGIDKNVGPAGPARNTLIGVFGGNEVAAFAYAQQLAEWMGKTTIVLDQQFFGDDESGEG